MTLPGFAEFQAQAFAERESRSERHGQRGFTFCLASSQPA